MLLPSGLESLHEHFRQLVAEKTRGFLPRSRRWLFDRVEAWLADPDGACVRVLLGDPGVGKSAAVMHLLKSVNLATHKRVAAFHVCDAVRNPGLTVLDVSLVVRSLVWQLARAVPAYERALLALRGKARVEDVLDEIGDKM